MNGLVVIFAIASLLAGYGTLTSFKNKNYLGVFFAAGTFLVLGWFTVMTVITQGFPAVH